MDSACPSARGLLMSTAFSSLLAMALSALSVSSATLCICDE